MATSRTSRTTTISLPPKLYGVAVAMARSRGMTKSELFRDALRTYQRQDGGWRELVVYGEKRAMASGIRNEADVERIINEARR
jgi:metal-responsive CopG/Arc/MetJ family transcriptional regulator